MGLRVVDVCSFFADEGGGIRRYLTAKAEHLPRAGVEHHIVVPGATTTSDERLGGAVLHRIAGPRLPGSAGYRAFGDLGALARRLVALAPDVVELGSHYVLPDLVARALAGLWPAPRLFGWYHADWPDTYVAPALASLGAPALLQAAAARAAWAWTRRQHRRYTATLVASQVMARTLRAHGVPRVCVIGLGVDTQTFHPFAAAGARGAATPTVVYVGRLGGEKGLGTLLDAWDRVAAATGAHLLLAGNGPLLPRVRAFAASRPSVRWLGHLVEAREVAALLAGADLAVVPGPHESFSLAAAEALASGTPLLAADRGGAAELCTTSGGGRRFTSGDAGDLAAQAIALLGAAPATRAALGAAGRAHAIEWLTWPTVFARQLEAYGEPLAPARAAAVAA